MILRDKLTLTELYSYVELGIERYGCEDKENQHDDRIDALRWACYFTLTDYWLDLAEYIRQERGITTPVDQIREITQDIRYEPIVLTEEFPELRHNQLPDDDGLIWPSF